MKRLFLVLLVFLFVVGTAVAAEQTITLQWEQPCVDGCPDATPPVGGVEEWRVYMSDTPGTYGDTPIITMPYDGSATPNYTSTYVLTLEGAGIKYFIVRAWRADFGESPDSNEVDLPYNFAGTATPINLTFTISTP